MKRGVFTHRRVQCAHCGSKWYVNPRQVGDTVCPRCNEVTRTKGAAALADADAKTDRLSVTNEEK